jgi:UPF0176 protein
MNSFLTAALYKFVELPNFAELKAPLMACCDKQQVKGTLILAQEGINGTIAGPPEGVYAVLAFLRTEPQLTDLTHKESFSEKPPFKRLKVRVKREIVTMGVPGIDPTQLVGQYVKPEDWNKLLDDPDVVVVDVRNDFEVKVGTFKGAVNPHTTSFTELPKWVQQEAELLKQKPKIAMFCTGGIRCEKSTALLRSQGFSNVYHLEGGILKYLELVPEAESQWEGECFVFDERVTVGHGLKPGNFELCRGCRHPISPEEKDSPFFVPGVSCSHCHDQKTEAQQKSFAERQRQIELARSRNQVHLGANRPSKEKSENLAALPKVKRVYPILYSFRRCPYAIRARLALSVSEQTCELREVVLRDKPQEMLGVSAKGTVPVLVDLDGSVLDESLDIMRWALGRHDPEQWLMPEHGSLSAMLELIALFDNRFKYHLDRYKYPGRYESADTQSFARTHRTGGSYYLAQLNSQLVKAPYLFGARVSLADMAIAPFVRQFALNDFSWFAAEPWLQLQNWLTTIIDSDRFTRCLQKYSKWTPLSPIVLFPTKKIDE